MWQNLSAVLHRTPTRSYGRGCVLCIHYMEPEHRDRSHSFCLSRLSRIVYYYYIVSDVQLQMHIAHVLGHSVTSPWGNGVSHISPGFQTRLLPAVSSHLLPKELLRRQACGRLDGVFHAGRRRRLPRRVINRHQEREQDRCFLFEEPICKAHSALLSRKCGWFGPAVWPVRPDQGQSQSQSHWVCVFLLFPVFFLLH